MAQADITGKIIQVLHKCHPNKDDFKVKSNDLSELKKSKKEVEKGKLENIKRNAEKLLVDTECKYIGSIEYASLNKMLAVCNLETGNELAAIYHLIESHAVIFRQHISHRYQKTKTRELIHNEPQTYGLKPIHVRFEAKLRNNDGSFKSKLLELPKEWYMVQVTAQYESPNILRHKRYMSSTMHAVHITILPTGPSDVEPLCITVPRPATQVSYDICTEIQKLLGTNKFVLKNTYVNKNQYWMMRANQNYKMETAIKGLENIWLREWRVLFMADPIEKLEMIDEIHQMIDKLILDLKPPVEISKRNIWLLKKVSVGAGFLTREEIAHAIKFLLPEHEKLANNIILSIYGKLPYVMQLKNVKRKTLVLIVDEHMDYLAFEAMEIIRRHPVTRLPSLHVAYALFKEHEDTIVEGCKIIKAKEDMGFCMVNPSGDLDKMEKRIKLFIDLLLPQWKSHYNTKPSGEMFKEALTEHDILLYSGHGSGIEYLPGQDIEKLRVKSSVLLFGCNSVKLLTIGGRFPPYGISNQYLIACSPCLLGMLWEVTDIDTDKMTSRFLSSWIPSSSERSWAEVNIDSWCSGTLKFTNERKEKIEIEPEMLRAVAKSKDSCSHYMTLAAIVVRGLPIKIV